MRCTHLRGRENISKRYLIHVCGHNLGLLMRVLVGAGTPGQDAESTSIILFCFWTADESAIVLLAEIDADHTAFAVIFIDMGR